MDIVINNQNAVIYARYSSDRQNEQSIEGQLRVISEYAKREKIKVVNTYIDRAMTGRNDDRPDFLRMIEDAKQRNFGYVLVYKFDRFSRDRFNSLLYKQQLGKYGVKVVSVTEPITEGSQGILIEGMLDAYAEYYSAELAEKVRRGNRESRLKGQFTGGLCVFGYTIENKKYVIVPEEAEIVKKIFLDVSRGVTFKEIANELNSKGITHKGAPFRVNYIGKVIKNEKYIGRWIIKGEVYTNIVPAIIEEDLFYMVKNNVINNKKRAPHYRAKVNYLLSGKLFCGYCGAPINGETGTSKSGHVFTYYKCSTAKKGRELCCKKNIKKDYLEDYVIERIKDVILYKNKIEYLASILCNAYNGTVTENTELKVNEKELARTKNEINNIISAIKMGIFSETLKNDLTALEEKRNTLEIENLKLKSKSPKKLTKEEISDFIIALTLLDTRSEENKKRVIDRFVRKVILFDDKIDVMLYPIEDHSIFNDLDKQMNDTSSFKDINANFNLANTNLDGGWCSPTCPAGPPYSQKPNPQNRGFS